MVIVLHEEELEWRAVDVKTQTFINTLKNRDISFHDTVLIIVQHSFDFFFLVIINSQIFMTLQI